MKQLLLYLVSAALVLGVGAGSVYAYLTAQDKAVNQFGPSEVRISIEEAFEAPGELKPGQTIKKAPRVMSSSSVDCYVRMSVHFSDSKAEQSCEPLVIREGWSANADGYYYWQGKLSPGQTTTPLFEQVQIRADAKEIAPFDILVYAEAVQCANTSPEEAWKTMKQ